jgi:hypothetical protein
VVDAPYVSSAILRNEGEQFRSERVSGTWDLTCVEAKRREHPKRHKYLSGFMRLFRERSECVEKIFNDGEKLWVLCLTSNQPQ